MNIHDHYRTEMWDGYLEYGRFKGSKWFAIGGYRHPLFKAITREIEWLYGQNKYNIRDYTIYVCGGLLEDWVSWDVDMVLVGKRNSDAFEILSALKEIGFRYRVYIDANLQETAEGVLMNCGGMKDYDGRELTIAAYEISNRFVKDGDVSVYDWPLGDYMLHERELVYPFTKNLVKYKKEGYLYRPPITIEKLF